MRKVAVFDAFSGVCPFASHQCSVNNGYGCTHPEQDETDFDEELGKECGKCYACSCPLCCEMDAEDLDNPAVNCDGITLEDCADENGEFIADGEYVTVNIGDDATTDEKTAWNNYWEYINRYNQAALGGGENG